MNIVWRRARPLGILGGIWAVLFSVLVFVFTPVQGVVTVVVRGETGGYVTSVTESFLMRDNLPILVLTGFTTMMGMLGLVAMLSLKRRPQLRYALIWISGGAILIVSLLPGLVLLFPAAALLILAAIGMRGDNKTLKRDSGHRL